MKSKVLVTGGAGMIGSNLVKRLANLDYEVIVVDNLWRGSLDNLKNSDGSFVIDINTNFHNIDLSDQMPLGLLDGVDYVYHLADIVAGIGFVFKNQGYIFRKNILINSNVVNTVKKSSIKGFIYVGTACSFPEQLQSSEQAYSLKESDQYPANPESAYGWSKLMGEYEALLMEKETGIPVSVLILHNVYGTPCDLDEARSQVIPSLIRKAIIYPDVDFEVWGSGRQGRAFIHVNDVVDALIKTKSSGMGHGAIQIGPSVCTSISRVAEEIIKVSNKGISIKYDLTKPEGDKARCADYSKAKQILGWEPRITLNQGIADMYKWCESMLLRK
jgi:GDP-D-mannose 3',5'-epimerase